MQQDDSRSTSTVLRIGVWIRRWPLTSWAVCALVLLLCLGAVGSDYDSSPFGILVITEGAWAWMYWVSSEILFKLNGGTAVAGHDPIAAIIGLSIAAIADLLLRTLRSRSSRLANT